MKWLDSGFQVGMPHMVPGQLSEVEMFKLLGDCQWQAISSLLGTPSQDIVNDQGERLYASFINVGVSLGSRSFRDFGEGAAIHIRHTARFYARRFVEGVLYFDNAEIPDAALPTEITPEALAASGVPHVYMTNAFVTRETSNLRLRTFVPAGAEPDPSAVVDEMPGGIRDHGHVQRTGDIVFSTLDGATAVPGMSGAAVTYEIVPESDVNGAGLLYFARYPAIMNYGERKILRGNGPVPVSSGLISMLSTERRRIFYFANADPNDQIRIQVSVHATAGGNQPEPDPTLTTPLRLHFTTELYRVSDGTLMAKSVVRKALRLPSKAKRLVNEASRLGHLWGVL